jgi:hypothetical protein
MARGLVHATVDLIAFGKPYLNVHQEKDKAARTLGSWHRKVDHPWYWQFGKDWTFADPFPEWLRQSIANSADTVGPDHAETQEVILTHEYVDRVWDELSRPERKYWEGFMVWLLLNPALLKTWAGVDVCEGTIHRVVDGQEIWEPCVELKRLYKELKRYAEFVKWKDPVLREMLSVYGQPSNPESK